MKKGLLLINLGTPDAPDIASVRRYLREFLADKRVITLPAPLRYALLYGLILPFRTRKTAHAYQSIWTSKGSPLLLNSLSLLKKLKKYLGDEMIVAMGMRYGNPSIQMALESLKQCTDITVLPLYPQFSEATTGSSIEKTLRYLSPKHRSTLRIIDDFYNHPGYINALTTIIKPYLANHDYILFSYHGLPEHHLPKNQCPSTRCDPQCPSSLDLKSTRCYRAQCFQTTQSIANQLDLSHQQYGTSFQSRLGRTAWIKPYTDEMLPILAKQGIKRLAVVCPSFVADCLETLEEIAIREKQHWLELGGSQFTLVPCLNDNDQWVEGIQKIIQICPIIADQ